jgi:hypothetical protein
VFGDEPAYGLACDLGPDHVAAIELTVAHLVAGPLELGNYRAAAAIDREVTELLSNIRKGYSS